MLESLLAMGLVLLVLGLVSTLMREYTSMSRHEAARDSSFDGVQFALTEIGNELAGAVHVVTPGKVGQSADRLVFDRLHPAPSEPRLPPRVLLEEGEEALTYWDFRKASDLIRVTYRQNAQGLLLRQTEDGRAEQHLAERVKAFRVKRLSERYYDLSLSFQEDKRVRRLSVRAKVWIKPEPES